MNASVRKPGLLLPAVLLALTGCQPASRPPPDPALAAGIIFTPQPYPAQPYPAQVYPGEQLYPAPQPGFIPAPVVRAPLAPPSSADAPPQWRDDPGPVYGDLDNGAADDGAGVEYGAEARERDLYGAPLDPGDSRRETYGTARPAPVSPDRSAQAEPVTRAMEKKPANCTEWGKDFSGEKICIGVR